MLRRFLLGIMVVSLASLAWAGVPDLTLSTASIDPAANGASVYVIPNGQGVGFDEAFLGGNQVDATITLTLVDSDTNPIFGYPFEDLWLGTTADGLVACPGGTTADGSTDELGQTEWQNPLRAGGSSAGEATLVYVAGTALAGGGIDLTYNSADLNGDLQVNLSDVVPFTQDLTGGTNPYRSDFNNDGVVNLSDIVRFTPAVGAICQ